MMTNESAPSRSFVADAVRLLREAAVSGNSPPQNNYSHQTPGGLSLTEVMHHSRDTRPAAPYSLLREGGEKKGGLKNRPTISRPPKPLPQPPSDCKRCKELKAERDGWRNAALEALKLAEFGEKLEAIRKKLGLIEVSQGGEDE